MFKPIDHYNELVQAINTARTKLLENITETLPTQIQDVAIADLTAYVDHLIGLAYTNNDVQFSVLLSDSTINALLNHMVKPLTCRRTRTKQHSRKLCQKVVELAAFCQQQRTSRGDVVQGNHTSAISNSVVAEYNGIDLRHQEDSKLDDDTIQAFLPNYTEFHHSHLTVKSEKQQQSNTASSSRSRHTATLSKKTHRTYNYLYFPSDLKSGDDYKPILLAAEDQVISCLKPRLPVWVHGGVIAEVQTKLDHAIN